MDTNLLSNAARLSDPDLLAHVKHLAYRERQATVALLVHLAELDARRLYLGEGHSSMFAYCTQVLQLSESAAYRRIEAARAARRFPSILERLEDGTASLTTVRLLAPHLTEDNHRGLLDATRGASRRDVEELVARLRPQPSVPDVIRKLPPVTSALEETMALLTAALAAPGEAGGDSRPCDAGDGLQAQGEGVAHGPPRTLDTGPMSFPGRDSVRSAVVTPLAPDRYKVSFTASTALHAKLRQAQALLRHQIPNGDLAKVFDRALTALLRDLAKQKAAGVERPRRAAVSNAHGVSESRHIPSAVKRAVWGRDAGRCAFVAPNGRRCGERGFLEFHHVVPYANGGQATEANIELRCRAHNGYQAACKLGERASKWRGTPVREARASYGSATNSPLGRVAGEVAGSLRPGGRTMRWVANLRDRESHPLAARHLGRRRASSM
jgi:5-methylcytosine-specific restriction endonuclease McrA